MLLLQKQYRIISGSHFKVCVRFIACRFHSVSTQRKGFEQMWMLLCMYSVFLGFFDLKKRKDVL